MVLMPAVRARGRRRTMPQILVTGNGGQDAVDIRGPDDRQPVGLSMSERVWARNLLGARPTEAVSSRSFFDPILQASGTSRAGPSAHCVPVRSRNGLRRCSGLDQGRESSRM